MVLVTTRFHKTFSPQISHHAPGVPTLLVGLKSDLRSDSNLCDKLEVVTPEDAEKVRDSIGAVCSLECSALTQENLKCVFDEAIRAALGKEQKKKKSKCCVL